MKLHGWTDRVVSLTIIERSCQVNGRELIWFVRRGIVKEILGDDVCSSGTVRYQTDFAAQLQIFDDLRLFLFLFEIKAQIMVLNWKGHRYQWKAHAPQRHRNIRLNLTRWTSFRETIGDEKRKFGRFDTSHSSAWHDDNWNWGEFVIQILNHRE